MQTLRAERVSLLLARQLPRSVAGYYQLVDESTEEQVPASRVLKIEQVEPLGLAVQMYARCRQQPGTSRRHLSLRR